VFQLENGEISDILHESQRNAFKLALSQLQDKYNFTVNEDAIGFELIEKLRPLWTYKRQPSVNRLEHHLSSLDPFIDNPITDKRAFFKDLKKLAVIPYFTKIKAGFRIKHMSPFIFNEKSLLLTLQSYRKRIEKAASQAEQFHHFLQFLGHDCQFQTLEDRLKGGIENYINTFRLEEKNRIAARMMKEINQSESAPLIPNIARYLRENQEQIFNWWFCSILPFDKSRFMVSQTKTGSRTDFIVRIQYTFRKFELRLLSNALVDSTELLIRAKTSDKIAKINKDSRLDLDKKKQKIAKVQERLQKNLLPANLVQTQEKNASGTPMVARFLLLNSEKAFNMVLNKIIRFHYKKLKITTSVTYITNVLESGAHEIRTNLKAFYLIHSREW
jgi:hypothetical protein